MSRVLDPVLIVFVFSTALLIFSIVRRSRFIVWFLALIQWSLLVVLASPYIVNRLVERMELQYADNPACLHSEGTTVVLGGGLDSRITRADEHHFMSGATFARLSQARLSQRFPMVLAGGGPQPVPEALVMQDYLLSTGTPPELLLTEPNSKNTAENAENVKKLFEHREMPLSIVLVTSALHMKRAHAVFSRQGFDVCPLPVDRIAIHGVPWHAGLPLTSAMAKAGKLLHELAGIVFYRITGRL